MSEVRIEIEAADCVPWLAAQPEGCATLIVADPLYNIGYGYAEGTPGDRRTADEYLAWCREWVELSCRALRPGGWLYVVIGPQYAPELGVLVRRAGLDRRQVVWREGFGSYFRSRWGYEHRMLFAGLKPGDTPSWHPDAVLVPSRRQEIGDRRADPRGRVPGDVWDFSRVCGTFRERVEGVPTQLPEALVERVVRAHTLPGELVLDPFCGSGTTAAVCKRLARHCRTCDINPHYVDLARGRVGA